MEQEYYVSGPSLINKGAGGPAAKLSLSSLYLHSDRKPSPLFKPLIDLMWDIDEISKLAHEEARLKFTAKQQLIAHFNYHKNVINRCTNKYCLSENNFKMS